MFLLHGFIFNNSIVIITKYVGSVKKILKEEGALNVAVRGRKNSDSIGSVENKHFL